MGYIYKHTSKTTGKYYIGKSVEAYGVRWKCHLKSVRLGVFECPAFHNAIAKYGADDFIHEVLFDTDDKHLLAAKEIEYIKMFDATNKKLGYNIVKGGGSLGCVCSDENHKNLQP